MSEVRTASTSDQRQTDATEGDGGQPVEIETNRGLTVPLPRGQSDAVKKRELKALIERAAEGDHEAARRMISPFVTTEEKLLQYGLSAKLGLIPTYDLLFLTDRKIGDLEITPLTGGLNVEVAYLQKIDAFSLNQPAIPIWLRVLTWLLPPLAALLLCGSIAEEIARGSGLIFGLAGAVVGLLAAYYIVAPAIRRSFLRLKKSGVWCKLNGSSLGVLIFADRDKFAMLTEVTRRMTEIKRQLDKVAS